MQNQRLPLISLSQQKKQVLNSDSPDCVCIQSDSENTELLKDYIRGQRLRGKPRRWQQPGGGIPQHSTQWGIQETLP